MLDGNMYILYFYIIIFLKNFIIFLPFQEKAYEPSQKYKEGKYILEREQISKHYWTM